jgi:ubiquinone/menaquinone biosynthesis C-methylase UbiE
VNTQTKAEFDQYARDYMQELSHPIRNLVDPEGHYFIELKSLILEQIASQQLDKRKNINIVDVGTGLGLFEKFLKPNYPNIMAVDLSFEMLRVARTINAFDSSRSAYVQGNAYHLPLPDDHADLIFMSCVLHHIEGDEIQATLKELARICSPRGYIVFFEHNPYNPITQIVVKTTPLDRNAHLVTYKKLEQHANQAGIQIVDKEFFLYGTRQIDDFIDRHLPGWRKLPLGGQYALIGQKLELD